MSIDVVTIITALGGAAVLAAGCGALILKLFERTLDHRFRALEERSKIELDAHHKRTLALFEKQIAPLKTIVALSYRSWNIARDLTEVIVRAHRLDRDSLKKLQAYSTALEEMVLEERAIIPNQSFVVIHELKCALLSFVSLVESAEESIDFNHRDDSDRSERAREQRVAFAEKAQAEYKQLSSLYDYVATHVNEYLGSSMETKQGVE